MTPLQIRILCGLEDARLLEIITELRHLMGQYPSLSAGEIITFRMAWDRLNKITTPSTNNIGD